MSRDIYFFRKDKATIYNAIASDMSTFDAAILAIQNNIDGYEDEISRLQEESRVAVINAKIALGYRDALLAGNKAGRKHFQQEIDKNETIYNYANPTKIRALQVQLDNAVNVLMPQALKLKQDHALNLYNQEFANKGVDSKLEQNRLDLEQQANRMRIEADAAQKKLQVEGNLRIAEVNSKTNKMVIVSIVVVALIITTIIVIRRVKKNKAK